MSTDPAHSLADSLAGAQPPPNLQVNELDAQECLKVFKREHGWKLAAIASRGTFLDEEDINKFLDLSLPGPDELMALLEISRWVQADTFRCIIVDRLPQVIQRLVRISKNLKRLRLILGDPSQCAMYAVSILTEMALAETKDLVTASHRLGIQFSALILNLATPPGDCPLCQALHRRESVTGEKFHKTFPTYQQVLIYRGAEPRGLGPLRELAQALYEAPLEILDYARNLS